jgi:hypothetical protein
MQVDEATNNKSNSEDTVIQIKSRRKKTEPQLGSGESSVSNVATKSTPLKEGESTSLNNFRETIKAVLEEITSLEVNTMIVGRITMTSFDAKEFYLQLTEDVMYKTDQGLQDIKESLLNRSTQLKKKGALLPQQNRAPMLPKEAQIIDEYRTELTSYNQDLEHYKDAERSFSDRQNSLDPEDKTQFALEQACYEQLAKQILKLDIPRDETTREIIIDGKTLRSLRKLWEFQQSVLNGDRIYAQTKFSLDGDLTNRFIDDLFMPSKSRDKIDPKMAGLVFDLHRQGVENAQRQWSGLIDTCVNLIKNLMQFRK